MNSQDEAKKMAGDQNPDLQIKKDELMQIVIFNQADEELAIEIKDIQEIILPPEITPVPGTPDFIRGIFNLRGKIIVAVDLEKKFGLGGRTKKREGNVIVSLVDNNNFGIIVEKVTEILKIPISSIQTSPAISNSNIHPDYLKGIVVLENNSNNDLEKIDSRLIVLLDLSKILQETELMHLEKKIN